VVKVSFAHERLAGNRMRWMFEDAVKEILDVNRSCPRTRHDSEMSDSGSNGIGRETLAEERALLARTLRVRPMEVT